MRKEGWRALVLIASGACLLCAMVMLAYWSPIGGETVCERYLISLGLSFAEEPLEIAEVEVPTEFDAVWERYMKETGSDLSPYRGERLVRYTYELQQFRGKEGYLANLLVAKGRVVGGDIMSVAIDGEMLPLTRDEN